jgi:alkylhydroperoxidase family enzyme
MTETPNWHDLPDRTRTPDIKRSAFHRFVIAAFKRQSKGHSFEFVRVLSINKRILRPYLLWNMRVMPYGTLDRKQTEAVVLRTAFLCGSKYEWTQHKSIGKQVGMTREEVDAAALDPASEVLDQNTRMLLAAIPELLENHVLSEATFDDLAGILSKAELLEFIMLVGNYAMLAGALNSFGAPIEEAWKKG